MKDRIKILRKNTLHLTQVEFGNRIGVTGTAVTGWEKGNRTPNEAILKLICKEFDVNYSWLVDGVGEMFVKTDDALLESLSLKYDLRDVEISLIREFIKLDKKDRDILLKYLHSVFGKEKDE